MCVGAGICEQTGEGDSKLSETTAQQSTADSVFTSVWKELGVDLLEGFLVHYTTGTLLQQGGDVEVRRQGGGMLRMLRMQRHTQVRLKSDNLINTVVPMQP